MEEESKNKGIKFDFTINTTHVIAAIGVIGTILSVYIGLQNQLFDTQKSIQALRQASEYQASELSQVKLDQRETKNAIQTTLSELNNQLTTLRISNAARSRN